jgi:hypothetical protein
MKRKEFKGNKPKFRRGKASRRLMGAMERTFQILTLMTIWMMKMTLLNKPLTPANQWLAP